MNREIVDIVKKIASNLSYSDVVLETIAEKANEKKDVIVSPWLLSNLSQGIPGICLLYGKLSECFPEEEKWGINAHAYLQYLVKEINEKGFQSISMFSGAAGIGLAVVSVSDDFRNYTRLLSGINSFIMKYYDTFLDSIELGKSGTRSVSYDIIEGLSGVMSYLSIYGEKYRSLLDKGLEKLITLTDDIDIMGQSVPGWYIPSINQFSNLEKKLYPYGNFNTSFSHGVAGPLVILSEMKIKGITMEGQDEAINKIVLFLLKYKLKDEHRDFWKGQVDFREYVNKQLTNENIVRRDAWCYGNPGICYSLIIAGKAMKNDNWISYGIDNLRKTMEDIKGIFSPTFCHGYSGLYQILNSVELLIEKDIFSKEKQMLIDKIMSYYDPDYVFGFKNIEYDKETQRMQPFEEVGLLNGAVGICLSLLDGEYRSESHWKKAFALR